MVDPQLLPFDKEQFINCSVELVKSKVAGAKNHNEATYEPNQEEQTH